MNARVGRHCEVFFLAAVLFPLRLCLRRRRRCLLSTPPHQKVLQSIQKRCLIQTLSWSAPHSRHVPETSPRKHISPQKPSEARHNRTGELPLRRWCSLSHSSQTGWSPSAPQTSARQSSRPPWSWGRRFCFPLKNEHCERWLDTSDLGNGASSNSPTEQACARFKGRVYF